MAFHTITAPASSKNMFHFKSDVKFHRTLDLLAIVLPFSGSEKSFVNTK